jgi:hypothetical protein
MPARAPVATTLEREALSQSQQKGK